MMRGWAFRLVALGGLVLLAGCSAKGNNPTDVVPVRGKIVTANGQPVRWVVVTFQPTERNGTTATAFVGEEGVLDPKTLNNQDGIVAGTYKVVIEPRPGKRGTTVAQKYTDVTTTDLQVDVKSGDVELVVTMR